MTTFGLVLDCADPESLADFWAAALGAMRWRVRRIRTQSVTGNGCYVFTMTRFWSPVGVAPAGLPCWFL